MRVLDVSAPNSNATAALEQCLASDSAMAVKLEPATLKSAMTRLREEVFDAVLVRHQPEELDALAALAPLRAASPDYLAVIVLGQEPAETMTAHCLDASADGYVCVPSTDVRTLLWTLARAAERQQLLRESESRQQTNAQLGVRQHQQAIHQLRVQRSLLLEHLDDAQCDPNPPPWLVDRFVELLTIYVVSGSGSLRAEVRQLVDRLDTCEVTLAEALTAHTLAAERLALGLRNRPVWHVLGRANLLAYELVMQMQNREKVKA